MLSLIIVCFMAFQSHKKVKYSVDYYLFFYYHIQYVGFCMSGFSSPTLCIPNIKWTRVWVMILSLESIFRQIRFYCCTTFRSITNKYWVKWYAQRHFNEFQIHFKFSLYINGFSKASIILLCLQIVLHSCDEHAGQTESCHNNIRHVPASPV